MATLTVGTNSWVSVAEADTYLDEKFSAGNWATLAYEAKEQLLITSYRWINAQRVNIPASSTESNVKYAQIELAWYCYGHLTSHEKRRALYAQGVRDFKLSKFEEKLEKGGIPDFILDLIKEELTGYGGRFPVASRTFST